MIIREKEFRDAINDIMHNFKKEIKKSQILLIENEGLVKTLPY